MDHIHKLATFCIGRAVMFGALAIGTVMLSFAFDLALAFHAGAVMTLMMVQILIIKALWAPRQNPKRTEIWMYLDKKARPAGAPAKAVFLNVLKDVYADFARGAFRVACGLFAASLTIRVLHAAQMPVDLPGG